MACYGRIIKQRRPRFGGGYATDPNYPKKLIALMEQNLLHQYDLLNPEEEERMKIEQLTAERKKHKSRCST